MKYFKEPKDYIGAVFTVTANNHTPNYKIVSKNKIDFIIVQTGSSTYKPFPISITSLIRCIDNNTYKIVSLPKKKTYEIF